MRRPGMQIVRCCVEACPKGKFNTLDPNGYHSLPKHALTNAGVLGDDEIGYHPGVGLLAGGYSPPLILLAH
jgi:hypothetical protein